MHNADFMDLKELTTSEAGYYVSKKEEYLYGTSCKGKCAKLISNIYQKKNVTIHSCLQCVNNNCSDVYVICSVCLPSDNTNTRSRRLRK